MTSATQPVDDYIAPPSGPASRARFSKVWRIQIRSDCDAPVAALECAAIDHVFPYTRMQCHHGSTGHTGALREVASCLSDPSGGLLCQSRDPRMPRPGVYTTDRLQATEGGFADRWDGNGSNLRSLAFGRSPKTVTSAGHANTIPRTFHAKRRKE
nr:hypothetical protein CFP56_07821 [Quercus suber]